MKWRYGVEVVASRTANGGWEWHLSVGGKLVQTNDHNVGHFTGPEANPEEVLPELLRRAVAHAEREHSGTERWQA